MATSIPLRADDLRERRVPAVEFIRRYYRRVANRQFVTAWGMLPRRVRRHLGPFANWKAGHRRSLGVSLLSARARSSGSRAVVRIHLRARDRDACTGRVVRQYFRGQWVLAPRRGAWVAAKVSVRKTGAPRVRLSKAECAPPPSSGPGPGPSPRRQLPGLQPCLPPGPDVDCAGGEGNGPRYVEGPVSVTGSDPYDLDSDGDAWQQPRGATPLLDRGIRKLSPVQAARWRERLDYEARLVTPTILPLELPGDASEGLRKVAAGWARLVALRDRDRWGDEQGLGSAAVPWPRRERPRALRVDRQVRDPQATRRGHHMSRAEARGGGGPRRACRRATGSHCGDYVDEYLARMESGALRLKSGRPYKSSSIGHRSRPARPLQGRARRPSARVQSSATRRSAGPSATERKQYALQSVMRLFSLAVDEELLERNPFRGLMRKSEGRANQDPPTEVEMVMLLEGCLGAGGLRAAHAVANRRSPLTRNPETVGPVRARLGWHRSGSRNESESPSVCTPGELDLPKSNKVPRPRASVPSGPCGAPCRFRSEGSWSARRRAGGSVRPLLTSYWAQVQARAGTSFAVHGATKHFGVHFMKVRLGLPNHDIAFQAGWSESAVRAMVRTYAPHGHGSARADQGRRWSGATQARHKRRAVLPVERV